MTTVPVIRLGVTLGGLALYLIVPKDSRLCGLALLAIRCRAVRLFAACPVNLREQEAVN